MKRLVVTGARDWNCKALARRLIEATIRKHGTGWTLVEGGANGVDAVFAMAASAAGVDVDSFAAKWALLGPRAGPERNREMLDSGADVVLACHPDLAASKGTKDCCKQALARGIPVYLYASEDARPEALTRDDPRLK